MKGTDASLNLADYYYHILNTLSRKAKLYLVKRLTDSLLKDEKKYKLLFQNIDEQLTQS